MEESGNNLILPTPNQLIIIIIIIIIIHTSYIAYLSITMISALKIKI